MPCPRCEIKKEFIAGLGTHVDNQRRAHEQVDDESRQKKIEKARQSIFEKGARVSGTTVENILQDKSFVPTRVCDRFIVMLEM